MKTHCRCKLCRHRKKLKQHPDEYRNRVKCNRCGKKNDLDRRSCAECQAILSLAPKCENCRSRIWRKDEYRHRVELVQMRERLGRYAQCHSCFHYPHRIGSRGCIFNADGSYRMLTDEQVI